MESILKMAIPEEDVAVEEEPELPRGSVGCVYPSRSVSRESEMDRLDELGGDIGVHGGASALVASPDYVELLDPNQPMCRGRVYALPEVEVKDVLLSKRVLRKAEGLHLHAQQEHMRMGIA